MDTSAINIRDLSYTYPGANTATLHINEFKLARGEKVFLYGPSGGGKTTLLEILAGVLKSQTGSITVLGNDLGKMSAPDRDQFRANHMGYIFQSFNLIPYLSVIENITLPLYLSPLRRKHISKENEIPEAAQLCQMLGIELKLNTKVTELSVGQQQRVAVARALLGRPEIILADEPTSSLDFDHRERFIKILFAICNSLGTTVLFVSHDRSLEKLFDRSVSLDTLNRARVK